MELSWEGEACVLCERAEGRGQALGCSRVGRGVQKLCKSEGNSCGHDGSPGLQLVRAPRVLDAALTPISSRGWLSTGCICQHLLAAGEE